MKSHIDSSSVPSMALVSKMGAPAAGEVWLTNADSSKCFIFTIDDILANPKCVTEAQETLDLTYILFGAGSFPYIDMYGVVGLCSVQVQKDTMFVGQGNFVNDTLEVDIMCSLVLPATCFAENIYVNSDIQAGDDDFDFIGLPMTGYQILNGCVFTTTGNGGGTVHAAKGISGLLNAMIRNSMIYSAIHSDVGAPVTIQNSICLGEPNSISGPDIVSAGNTGSIPTVFGIDVKGTWFCGDDMIHGDGTTRRSCKSIFIADGVSIEV